MVSFPAIYVINVSPVTARVVSGVGFFVTVLGSTVPLIGSKISRIYQKKAPASSYEEQLGGNSSSPAGVSRHPYGKGILYPDSGDGIVSGGPSSHRPEVVVNYATPSGLSRHAATRVAIKNSEDVTVRRSSNYFEHVRGAAGKQENVLSARRSSHLFESKGHAK